MEVAMVKVPNLLEVFVFTIIVTLSSYALAAPQMLGLLTSAKPIPLTCKNGVCSAELSAYCLQSYRYAPDIGADYRFSAAPNVSIFAKSKTGHERKIDAIQYATIKGLRGHSAVRISVPANVLRKSGNVTAYISIGNFVTLVPRPELDDPQPITATELQAYTGPLRQVAEHITHRSSRDSIIVGTMNKLLNHLESTQPAISGEAAKLWQEAIGKSPAEDKSGGLHYAAKELAFCGALSEASKSNGVTPHGMRYCLEMVHDEFAREITTKVWQGLGPGG